MLIPNDDRLRTNIEFVNRLFKHIQYLIRRANGAAKENHVNSTYKFRHEKGECWGFIPSAERMIHKACEIINQQGLTLNSKIVDAGCGYSSILTLLKLYGFNNLCGIEYQKDIAKDFSYIFRQMYRGKEHKVYQADLLDDTGLIIKAYENAELVYSYMPIADEILYHTYMQIIANYVPKGCIVMDLYGPINTTLSKDKRFEAIENSIYKKIKS